MNTGWLALKGFWGTVLVQFVLGSTPVFPQAPDACGEKLGAVRVCATEQACFEYLFTGVAGQSGDQPMLAFNHRSGRTAFARPGDTLGQYRIASFEARTNRVYNESIHAFLPQPAGRVTLSGPGEVRIVLDENKVLPRPGLTAWLVRLDSGAWWNVNEGDTFAMDNLLVQIEKIAAEGVAASAGGDALRIALITPAEKEGLRRLWNDQKILARKKQEQEQERLQQEQAARAKDSGGGACYVLREPKRSVEIRGPSRFFYGSEYRFPTAFNIWPGTFAPGNRFGAPPVLIPTAFEWRYCGVSISAP